MAAIDVQSGPVPREGHCTAASGSVTLAGATGCPESLRILVVDDQVEFLSLLVAYLTHLNYDVRGADSTQVAIEQIERWSPDVVLTDVNMPGGGAPVVLEWLGQKHRSLPVLLMTGSVHDWAVRALGDGTARGVLYKPFRLQDLADEISRLGSVAPMRPDLRGG